RGSVDETFTRPCRALSPRAWTVCRARHRRYVGPRPQVRGRGPCRLYRHGNWLSSPRAGVLRGASRGAADDSAPHVDVAAEGRMSATAAYVRVSTRSQDGAMQRHAITKAGGVDVTVWYEEVRTASKRAPRPELERLIADAERGAVTCVWVYKLDRL